MTPSHDNLTSSKTPNMGDIAHPKSPRPSRNDAKKFTFDCVNSVASINTTDSRDVQNSKAEKVDTMEAGAGELRDVPMETAAEATEDDKLEAAQEGVGCDDPTVAGLMVTLKIDDDGKNTQGKSGKDDVAPNSWYLCGMDPTDLMTLTAFEASMNYLTASAGVDARETQPAVPFDEEGGTTKCKEKLETIEETKTVEAKIDIVAETLKAVCNRLHPVANDLESLLNGSRVIGSHGPEAAATAKPIAPVSIVTLSYVDSDIELAPSDEMENRSSALSPASQKSNDLRNEMRENGDVSFDNLKAFQAYV
jgi:hypothetical protein